MKCLSCVAEHNSICHHRSAAGHISLSQDCGAAGTCNILAAALCRHSAHFYSALERSGLLEPLIVLCRDEDRATRKFACFAIGNAGELFALSGLGMSEYATRWQCFQGQLSGWGLTCHAGTAWPQPPPPAAGFHCACHCLHLLHCVPPQCVSAHAGFHNASLYGPLQVSIRPLVALLSDEEDKTCANAAGALGNLVRNDKVLCAALIEAEALQVGLLLQVACFTMLNVSIKKDSRYALLAVQIL